MSEPATHAPDRDHSAQGDEPPGTQDLVSVIIIFLNEERHLAEAVQSVLAQDHSHWELLLVDDGSTDRSREIARRFAQQDSRITYLTHPGGVNRGMSASRNLGLANARGEYVTFLDGDDVYLPSRLSAHVEILAANPAIAMVVSDHLRWFSDYAAQAPGEAVYARSFLAVGDQVWKPPIGLMITMGVPYLALGICNVTVRREIAREVGGFENQFTALFEDQAFTSKVLARFPVYVLQGYLARYRHHAGSWTRRVKESGAVHGKVPHADTTRFLSWLIEHLHASAIADPLLLQLIHVRAAAASRTPNPFQQRLLRIGAALKRYLRAVIPDRWYIRLLVIDYERDQSAARADYARLGDSLSRRAVDEALDSDRA
jgi:glycosyltransferase involved in cell wall biosynthesis